MTVPGRLPSVAAVGCGYSRSMRQRDLSPLLFLSESCVDTRSGLSRTTVRRQQRREAWTRWANDGIRSLSLLAGRALAAPEGAWRPASCSAVVDQIASAYCDLGPPPNDAPTAEGALRERLASAQFYREERSDICPLDRNLVSWPELGKRPMSLEDCLPAGDRSVLFWSCKGIRSATPKRPRSCDLPVG